MPETYSITGPAIMGYIHPSTNGEKFYLSINERKFVLTRSDLQALIDKEPIVRTVNSTTVTIRYASLRQIYVAFRFIVELQCVVLLSDSFDTLLGVAERDINQ